MTDQLLGLLRIALLVTLYIFFARVLWAVWVEVRVPATPRPAITPTPRSSTSATGAIARIPRPFRVARMRIVSPVTMKNLTFKVNDNPFTIGRLEENNLCLSDDTYVSSRHARLYRQDGYLVVEDLGSTNGTFVKTDRVSGATQLRIGDRVQIGGVVLEAEKS
ncbi:MAG: FHA domain-containing protein [Actinomycetota bacterium]